jgi:hypothetical protein
LVQHQLLIDDHSDSVSGTEESVLLAQVEHQDRIAANAATTVAGAPDACPFSDEEAAFLVSLAGTADLPAHHADATTLLFKTEGEAAAGEHWLNKHTAATVVRTGATVRVCSANEGHAFDLL